MRNLPALDIRKKEENENRYERSTSSFLSSRNENDYNKPCEWILLLPNTHTHTHTHTPCPTKRKIKVNEAKIINLFPLFNAPHQRRNNPFRVFLLKIWEDTRLRTHHPSGLKSEEDRSNFHFLSKGLKGIIRASLLNSFNYTIISLSKIIRLGTNNLSIIPQLH